MFIQRLSLLTLILHITFFSNLFAKNLNQELFKLIDGRNDSGVKKFLQIYKDKVEAVGINGWNSVINDKNSDGLTPLMLSIKNRMHNSTIDKLAEFSQLYAEDKYGQNPFHYVARSNNAEYLTALVKASNKRRRASFTVHGGNVDHEICLHFTNQHSFMWEDYQGNTPVSLMKKNPTMIKKIKDIFPDLFNHGSDPFAFINQDHRFIQYSVVDFIKAARNIKGIYPWQGRAKRPHCSTCFSKCDYNAFPVQKYHTPSGYYRIARIPYCMKCFTRNKCTNGMTDMFRRRIELAEQYFIFEELREKSLEQYKILLKHFTKGVKFYRSDSIFNYSTVYLKYSDLDFASIRRRLEEGSFSGGDIHFFEKRKIHPSIYGIVLHLKERIVRLENYLEKGWLPPSLYYSARLLKYIRMADRGELEIQRKYRSMQIIHLQLMATKNKTDIIIKQLLYSIKKLKALKIEHNNEKKRIKKLKNYFYKILPVSIQKLADLFIKHIRPLELTNITIPEEISDRKIKQIKTHWIK